MSLDRVRSAMATKGVAALLINEITNVQWLSGFTGSTGWIIVTATEAVFLTDSRYTIQAAEQVRSMPVSCFASPVKSSEFIASHLKLLGIEKITFERSAISYKVYEEWQKAFAPTVLEGGPDIVSGLRMVKNPDEIQKTREACKLADACFNHVVRMLQVGVTEYDIALDIEFFFRRNHAELAFEPIVVSGANSARPHGRATEKKLAIGDFVTMDFGAKLDGFCSDLTRTVVIGEASDRHKEVYAQVLKANVDSIKFMKPGIRAEDVDALARRILDEKDLAKYFGHGLGHGLGKVVHDGGSLGVGSQDVLEVGQIWTVEPGVYIEGFGGVRVEDDVVVTPTGVEVLTFSPKELMVL